MWKDDRRFRISPLTLDTDDRTLVRDDGSHVHVPPMEMCLLVALAKANGNPVDATDLEESCGFRTPNALESRIASLRKLLRNEGCGIIIPRASAARYRLDGVRPASNMFLEELLNKTQLEREHLDQIFELVADTKDGVYNRTIPKSQYNQLHACFESVPGNRYAYGLPGSTCRTKPMSSELARLLYRNREPLTSDDLQRLILGVHQRHAKLREQLDRRHAVQDFFPADELLKFVNELVFRRAEQSLCEVQERLDTIERWLRTKEYDYNAYLISINLKPGGENFLLKECVLSGKGTLYFVIRYRGLLGSDIFEIWTSRPEQLTIVENWKRGAKRLCEYPNSGRLPKHLVFHVDSADAFAQWLSNHMRWKRRPPAYKCIPDPTSCDAEECPFFGQQEK